MSSRVLPHILAVLLALSTLCPIGARAQVAEFAGSAATGVVLKQLFADLTTMINKARDDGDYLLARAGVEAKNALDAWQQANGNLLDKAFSQLDKASRENFARAHQLVSSANTAAANRLETAQQIVENANQIIESIPLGGKETYVLRYSPRIQPPQTKESFFLRIRGVNLDKGDPKLHLTNGFAKRDQPGPLEAQFTIPSSEVPRDTKRIEVRSFKLTFSTPSTSWFARLFGKREEVTREIAVVALPINLATYDGVAVRNFSKRLEKPFTRDLGQFKAKNSRQYKVATPDNGWKWDLSKPLVKSQGQGESGRCEGVDMNNSSENGVSFFAHLDEIRNSRYPLGAPGYVSCALSGTVYRMEAATETVPLPSGVLSWVSDTPIPLPSNTDTLTLNVQTFDGRKRVINGTGTDQFFDVRREPRQLVVTPRVPEDLIK